jgi:hypothetical protein
MEMSEVFNLPDDKCHVVFQLTMTHDHAPNESLGAARVPFRRHVVLRRVGDSCDGL